jgi:hypothetical protein
MDLTKKKYLISSDIRQVSVGGQREGVGQAVLITDQ